MTKKKRIASMLDEILGDLANDPNYIAEGLALGIVEDALAVMEAQGMNKAQRIAQLVANDGILNAKLTMLEDKGRTLECRIAVLETAPAPAYYPPAMPIPNVLPYPGTTWWSSTTHESGV